MNIAAQAGTVSGNRTMERSDPPNPEVERRLRQALREIRFGTVTLVIQDGQVIQIDRNEKIRLR